MNLTCVVVTLGRWALFTVLSRSSTTPPLNWTSSAHMVRQICKKNKGKCTYIALRHGSNSVTCNYTNACLYVVSIHQMAPPQTKVAEIHLQPTTHLPTLKGWKAESAVGWLTYSGRFTHISGHRSAAGRAQDRERLPVKDRRSTTVPCTCSKMRDNADVAQLCTTTAAIHYAWRLFQMLL